MTSGSLLSEPRRWQREALAEWLPRKQGVVSVVTGAGKTGLALIAYARLRDAAPQTRLVVIVPTLALLDQWAVALTTEIGVSARDMAFFSGESRPAEPQLVNIAVINTARVVASTLGREDDCMLVVDECHRAGTPENAKALAVASDYRMGLSATPVRDFDDGFEALVEPSLGPIIYEYGYREAFDDGLIAPLALHNFQFPLSDNEWEQYEQLTRKIARRWAQSDDPHDDPMLKRLLLMRARISNDSPRRVIAAVAVTSRFEGRGLVFHERIPRAEQIARLLDRRGERVALYHSQMAATIRRRNLELFKTGQVSKLVTCRALDEGLNVPDATVAVVAASTRSTRQRIQRLGRVLRVSPGKDEATVATMYATRAERDALIAEAASLDEVASVHWYEVKL